MNRPFHKLRHEHHLPCFEIITMVIYSQRILLQLLSIHKKSFNVSRDVITMEIV